MTLYHYTCHHGRDGIGERGRLLSAATLRPAEVARMPTAWQRQLADMIWLTDLDAPDRVGLGLTANTITCDRTRHRYRVEGYVAMRYLDIRTDLPRRIRDGLEAPQGVLPAHWFVAYTPVPVVYDPPTPMEARP